MREVVIVAWCDACAVEGRRTEAEALTETLGGKEVEIDLCGEHAAPLRAALALLGDLGRPVRKSARKSRSAAKGASGMGEGQEFVCPECGLTSASAQGLGAHRAKKHDYVSDSPGARARRRIRDQDAA